MPEFTEIIQIRWNTSQAEASAKELGALLDSLERRMTEVQAAGVKAADSIRSAFGGVLGTVSSVNSALMRTVALAQEAAAAVQGAMAADVGAAAAAAARAGRVRGSPTEGGGVIFQGEPIWDPRMGGGHGGWVDPVSRQLVSGRGRTPPPGYESQSYISFDSMLRAAGRVTGMEQGDVSGALDVFPQESMELMAQRLLRINSMAGSTSKLVTRDYYQTMEVLLGQAQSREERLRVLVHELMHGFVGSGLLSGKGDLGNIVSALDDPALKGYWGFLDRAGYDRYGLLPELLSDTAGMIALPGGYEGSRMGRQGISREAFDPYLGSVARILRLGGEESRGGEFAGQSELDFQSQLTTRRLAAAVQKADEFEQWVERRGRDYQRQEVWADLGARRWRGKTGEFSAPPSWAWATEFFPEAFEGSTGRVGWPQIDAIFRGIQRPSFPEPEEQWSSSLLGRRQSGRIDALGGALGFLPPSRLLAAPGDVQPPSGVTAPPPALPLGGAIALPPASTVVVVPPGGTATIGIPGSPYGPGIGASPLGAGGALPGGGGGAVAVGGGGVVFIPPGGGGGGWTPPGGGAWMPPAAPFSGPPDEMMKRWFEGNLGLLPSIGAPASGLVKQLTKWETDLGVGSREISLVTEEFSRLGNLLRRTTTRWQEEEVATPAGAVWEKVTGTTTVTGEGVPRQMADPGGAFPRLRRQYLEQQVARAEELLSSETQRYVETGRAPARAEAAGRAVEYWREQLRGVSSAVGALDNRLVRHLTWIAQGILIWAAWGEVVRLGRAALQEFMQLESAGARLGAISGTTTAAGQAALAQQQALGVQYGLGGETVREGAILAAQTGATLRQQEQARQIALVFGVKEYSNALAELVQVQGRADATGGKNVDTMGYLATAYRTVGGNFERYMDSLQVGIAVHGDLGLSAEQAALAIGKIAFLAETSPEVIGSVWARVAMRLQKPEVVAQLSTQYGVQGTGASDLLSKSAAEIERLISSGQTEKARELMSVLASGSLQAGQTMRDFALYVNALNEALRNAQQPLGDFAALAQQQGNTLAAQWERAGSAMTSYFDSLVVRANETDSILARYWFFMTGGAIPLTLQGVEAVGGGLVGMASAGGEMKRFTEETGLPATIVKPGSEAFTGPGGLPINVYIVNPEFFRWLQEQRGEAQFPGKEADDLYVAVDRVVRGDPGAGRALPFGGFRGALPEGVDSSFRARIDRFQSIIEGFQPSAVQDYEQRQLFAYFDYTTGQMVKFNGSVEATSMALQELSEEAAAASKQQALARSWFGGFERLPEDVSISDIESRASFFERAQANAMNQAGLPYDPQYQTFLFWDEGKKTFVPLTTTSDALRFAIEDLTKAENKRAQLEGLWNVPAGADIRIPFASLNLMRDALENQKLEVNAEPLISAGSVLTGAGNNLNRAALAISRIPPEDLAMLPPRTPPYIPPSQLTPDDIGLWLNQPAPVRVVLPPVQVRTEVRPAPVQITLSAMTALILDGQRLADSLTRYLADDFVRFLGGGTGGGDFNVM